jgi:hypothetical protein
MQIGCVDMAIHAKKTETREKPPSRYRRIPNIVSRRFFKRFISTSETEEEDDDFIDIVLDADIQHDGKVKSIR